MSKTTAPVVLVLGAGPNIGKAVASLFSAHGFRVAVVARSFEDGTDASGTLTLHGDLSYPSSIPAIYAKVKAALGPPSVVIYNGAVRTLLSRDDPLSQISVEQLESDMRINVTSALVAAQQALVGFRELPPSPLKTFFYTGNKLNMMPSPPALLFGMGKSAAAHMVWDCSVAYRDLGFKFYFTDERFEDGSPTRDKMSGEARAEVCLSLVNNPVQMQWQYTFVKGKGYVDFSEIDKQSERSGAYE